jgi:hypothetical protein
MTHNSSTRRRRRGFSLLGLLLVGFGTLLLLTVSGVAGLGIWFELVSYWPVLLILLGIKMILAPRAPLVGMAVVSLVIVATIAAAWVPLSVERIDDTPRIAYSTPLENTETFELGMGFVSGRVALRSDPSGDRLFAVDFNNRPADVIHDHMGSFSKIYLSTDGFSVDYSDGEGDFTLSGLADWDLMVSPDVALDLDIRAGAADLDLDLTHLNVRRVFVGAGASQVRIRLPDSGKTLVEIEAGAADIQITVPQGVAARIDNDSFLNSTSIDSGRFPKLDGEHRSPDFFTAEDRVDIDIEAGASSVTVG